MFVARDVILLCGYDGNLNHTANLVTNFDFKHTIWKQH
jgi:hypothetical protein